MENEFNVFSQIETLILTMIIVTLFMYICVNQPKMYFVTQPDKSQLKLNQFEFFSSLILSSINNANWLDHFAWYFLCFLIIF